ncbi:uncharacterized protein KY384_004234 [Bacidia gigantensis]|uniref:uncharacterized protein n=1 Tax=Bacidia gigantensis TaxID=2732470 RepID=UPI001D03744E|nr:uncharacterized protein KY384_004234 [Bacidia gigantensis]KAG8530877.1 hypothetical protein KY384_004234 [Bacidia gigantensis]
MKVEELCHQLWPEKSRHIGQQFRKLFRRKKNVSQGPTKTFQIERLEGGSFNRIIGVAINDSDKSKFVLRIPRFEFARPARDAAILRYVRQRYPQIPVPEIEAADFTSHNVLNEPYMVQKRIPGIGLHSKECRFPGLTHDQKHTFAAQFGKILRSLMSVKNEEPGQIEGIAIFGSAQAKRQVPCFRVRPFDVDADLTRCNPDLDEMTVSGEQPKYESHLEFFLTQFGRYKAAAMKRNAIAEAEYMAAFASLAIQLDQSGFLGQDARYVLCHLDLNMSPHNIMVKIDDKANLSITGILDWDSAVLLPTFAACQPPMWVWAWDKEEPEDERAAGLTPLSPEMQELKAIFEDAVGDEWLKYRYQPGFRIARKLCDFAINGLTSPQKMEEANDLIKEWASMRPEGMEEVLEPRKSDNIWILNDDFDQGLDLPKPANPEIYPQTVSTSKQDLSVELKLAFQID